MSAPASGRPPDPARRRHPIGTAAPETDVALPEVAVPPHVFVLPLPAAEPPDRIVDRWLEQLREQTPEAADSLVGELRSELVGIVAAAGSGTQPGEIAAFLSYRGDRAPGCDSRLVGGAAVLTLELLDARPGPPLARAESLAVDLRQTAERLGHDDGLTEIGSRRTASGVPAVRLRFLAIAEAGGASAADGAEDCAETPMVEACRWLYPVPGHGDLAWSLVFQTTDIVDADALVAEFDQLAGSLAWAGP